MMSPGQLKMVPLKLRLVAVLKSSQSFLVPLGPSWFAFLLFVMMILFVSVVFLIKIVTVPRPVKVVVPLLPKNLTMFLVEG